MPGSGRGTKLHPSFRSFLYASSAYEDEPDEGTVPLSPPASSASDLSSAELLWSKTSTPDLTWGKWNKGREDQTDKNGNPIADYTLRRGKIDMSVSRE